MKFVIKSIVQCDFPQGGFRLGKKKLTNHFQFGFHLEGGKSYSAGLMEPIVYCTFTNKIAGSNFMCREKGLWSCVNAPDDLFDNGIGDHPVCCIGT